MPLVKIYQNKNKQIGIWEILENEVTLYNKEDYNTNYHPNLDTYKNIKRKEQILATRKLSKIMFPQHNLSKNLEGKPIFIGSELFVSISNTKNITLIMVSSERCGIDIQYKQKNILKLQNKFLNKNDFVKDINIENLMWAWCAKESMYKVFGNSKINFKNNLTISYKNGIFTGFCNHSEFLFSCEFDTNIINGYYFINTKNIQY